MEKERDGDPAEIFRSFPYHTSYIWKFIQYLPVFMLKPNIDLIVEILEAQVRWDFVQQWRYSPKKLTNYLSSYQRYISKSQPHFVLLDFVQSFFAGGLYMLSFVVLEVPYNCVGDAKMFSQIYFIYILIEIILSNLF